MNKSVVFTSRFILSRKKELSLYITSILISFQLMEEYIVSKFVVVYVHIIYIYIIKYTDKQ